MLVVSRFLVVEDEAECFRDQAAAALAAFAGRPGYTRGRLGRSVDDPSVWVLTTEWDGVGSYRRSLSSYEVKVDAAPLLGRARDEPSAFEVLLADDAGRAEVRPSRRAADAATVAVGEAAAPDVRPAGGY